MLYQTFDSIKESFGYEKSWLKKKGLNVKD